MPAERTEWVEAIVHAKGVDSFRAYFDNKPTGSEGRTDVDRFLAAVDEQSPEMFSIGTGRMMVRPSEVVRITFTPPRPQR